MKKTLVAAILGLAAIASTFAQGSINLDTYNTSPYPKITYGPTGGGTLGEGVASFNFGFYWAAGAVSVPNDPSGYGPSSIWTGVGLSLASGTGASAVTGTAGTAGYIQNPANYIFAGVPSGSVTIVAVAYNGASYDASLIRGHSAAFSITPAQGLATAPGIGSTMPTFAVNAVPEPSTFALAGLGLASLLIFRRRK